MKHHARWLAVMLSALLATPSSGQDRLSHAERADIARIRGARTAATWLVLVGDLAGAPERAFQHDVWPMIDSLFVRPGRLRVAWVNLPDDTSKASQIAAEVVACSSADRKFWSPHEVILEDQPNWRYLPDPTEKLKRLAVLRGARMSVVTECLEQHWMRGFLQADVARARQAGVRKAPGYILGNTVLKNVRTPEEFRSAIQRALPKQAPPAGRPAPPVR
jgi:hypothetical protein